MTSSLSCNEQWKDIEGYEGKYQISSNGKIVAINYRGTGETKEVRPRKDKDGYLIVNLYKGERKTYRVHRLVAKAFIPNPDNYPCINHIDETRDNNSVSNLEWCTYKYNSNYGQCRENIRKARTGQKATEETRAKLRKAKSKENHPMWGKKHSEETKTKMRKSKNKYIEI